MLFHSYNVPGKNPFHTLGHDSLPSGYSFTCMPRKTYVCPVQTYDPNDQMTEHYSHQFIRTSVFSPWPQEDSQSCHNALQVQIFCLLNSKLTIPSSPISKDCAPVILKPNPANQA